MPLSIGSVMLGLGMSQLSILESMGRLFDPTPNSHIFWPVFVIRCHLWRSYLNVHRNPKPPRRDILQHLAFAVWQTGLSHSSRTMGIPRRVQLFLGLRVAIKKRHLDVARLLLDHGACADIRINGDWTLLHHASHRWDRCYAVITRAWG